MSVRIDEDFGGESWAAFSSDDVYRYMLARRWDDALPWLVVCGLNPSTADAFKDDHTIRREIGFARRWKCGGLYKVNAYAYRSTDPDVLEGVSDPVGAHTDTFIRRAARLVQDGAGVFLVAWGANIQRERERELATLLTGVPLQCLGRNLDGSPKHPLYLPYTTPLAPWEILD